MSFVHETMQYIAFRLIEAVGYTDKKFALVIDGSSLRFALEGKTGSITNIVHNMKCAMLG